jgi:hypothetical protein
MATRRLIIATSLALVAITGSVTPISGAGTCSGDAAAYTLSEAQRDATLTAYDSNGDGIICVLPEGSADAVPNPGPRLPYRSIPS